MFLGLTILGLFLCNVLGLSFIVMFFVSFFVTYSTVIIEWVVLNINSFIIEVFIFIDFDGVSRLFIALHL